MSQSPKGSQQTSSKPPVPVDPKFSCSACLGMTIKEAGKKPVCYGYRSEFLFIHPLKMHSFIYHSVVHGHRQRTKQQLSLDGLKVVERVPPMQPNTIYFAIGKVSLHLQKFWTDIKIAHFDNTTKLGKTVHSERLQKDDKPPYLISLGFDTIFPNQDTTKATSNKVPDNASKSEETIVNNTGKPMPSLPKGTTSDGKENSPSPVTVFAGAALAGLKKGSLIQLSNMRKVFGDLTTNFPQRYQRYCMCTYQISILAIYIDYQL